MKRALLICLLGSICLHASAQTFEITAPNESLRGVIGEVIKAPIQFRNNSEKLINVIVRRVETQIGGTQKTLFCLNNECFDHKLEEYTLKLEPRQATNSLQLALEAGLAPGNSHVRYIAINKANPQETVEFEVHFSVEEKLEKEMIFSSPHFTLYNVYPNPVEDYALVDYKAENDLVGAKLVLHNILGNPIENYPLPASETKVKIKAEQLNAGIYFYTLYLNNEGVVTRKLVVKK